MNNDNLTKAQIDYLHKATEAIENKLYALNEYAHDDSVGNIKEYVKGIIGDLLIIILDIEKVK